MNALLVTLVFALALVLVTPANGVECVINSHGMAEVEGKPTFVLGLYEYPEDDAALKEVAEAGFNLVHAKDTDTLDRLHAHGLWGWVNTGMDIDLHESTQARTAGLTEMAETLAGHPALLAWEVPDEALWNCWYIPSGWRGDEEPSLLSEKVESLEDTALRTELRKALHEAGRLRGIGDHARAEAIADGIWDRLGEKSPRPNLYFSKAAERSAAMADGMVQGHTLLRKLDPDHPIWMNHAPRNQIAQLANFNRAADIVGCDIYPVPVEGAVRHSDLVDRTLSSVGAYTDRMQAAAPEKPVWMVLQGFGWGDILPERPEEEREELRQPTARESRFMAYDAIVHGTRGILYWGSHYTDKTTEFWPDLLGVIRELADLQPVLSAPDAKLDLTVTLEETNGSLDRAIEVLPKAVDGKTWLIVVNESPYPLHYTLHGLAGLDGKTFREQTSGEEAKVRDGSLSMRIAGHAVQVLGER